MTQIQTIQKFIRNSTELKTKITKINKAKLKNGLSLERKITNNNGDVLFCVRIQDIDSTKIYSLYQSVRLNLENARIIETVFPFTFNWFFDGQHIRTLSYIPSSNPKIQGTLSRYGGTTNFIKTIKRHLINVTKAKHGISINYVFDHTEPIDEFLTVIGTINPVTNLYAIPITLNMTIFEIITKASTGIINDFTIPKMNINFWKREVNPDLVDLHKPILNEKLPIDFNNYPPCIKNLMNLKVKGNYNRFLLITILLNLHSVKDTKFILKHVLNDKEYEHITKGNCQFQLPFIINNIERYTFPTCIKMGEFCEKTCNLSHPLEYYEQQKTKDL